MGAIYVKRLILSVALIIPIASNASDALNQPSSSLNAVSYTHLTLPTKA